MNGKGSKRRPGENYADNWSAIFGKERREVVSEVDCRTCAWLSRHEQCLHDTLCLNGQQYEPMLPVRVYKVTS